MSEKFERLQDIVDASGGALTVETNAPDLELPIEEVRVLIYAPHAAPKTIDEIDPAEAVQEFLRQDPSAREVLQYSWYRADGGAREMGEEALAQLGQQGVKAALIRPRWFGRGLLELNRGAETAIGDGLFKVPGALKAPLQGIHRNSIGALWTTAHQLFHGGKLQGVLQPHTMASGDPTDAEVEEIDRLVKELAEYQGTNAARFADPEKAAALLSYWREVYQAMNERRDRADVDVILNQHKKPEVQIGDPKTANRFLESLQEQGIDAAYDTPFGHIPGYPGSELSAQAVAADVPELIFDAPRHVLLANPYHRYPLTGFKPDPSRIRVFAATALKALQRG